MTPELRRFLNLYYNWIRSGAPDFEPFRRDVGLCSNANMISVQTNKDLKKLLKKEFSCPLYPFNSDKEQYNLASRNSGMHLNSKRNEWVRKMLDL